MQACSTQISDRCVRETTAIIDQFHIVQEDFSAEGTEAREKYLWKNSQAACRWTTRQLTGSVGFPEAGCALPGDSSGRAVSITAASAAKAAGTGETADVVRFGTKTQRTRRRPQAADRSRWATTREPGW